MGPFVDGDWLSEQKIYCIAASADIQFEDGSVSHLQINGLVRCRQSSVAQDVTTTLLQTCTGIKSIQISQIENFLIQHELVDDSLLTKKGKEALPVLHAKCVEYDIPDAESDI